MSAIYQKIMVPLDGSDLASSALPHAQELAKRYDAEVVLFQAVSPPAHFPAVAETGETGATAGAGAVGPITISPDEEELRHHVETAQRMLERVGDDLRHRHVQVRIAVDVGQPADAIVDYAEANKVDLIVMSTHGRTGLARWAFGSVAMKVIHAATCPVLTIRPVEEPSEDA